MVMGTEVTRRWGTWEELLLGGAILRHGTRDWNVVAAELRARATGRPYTFTPEVCKAKYEDLQQRYSGCTAWFEELRKQRMAELRRALEQSEDSIGSLESKLESLKAKRKEDCNVDYDYSQTESPVPFQKSEGVEYTSKDTSKDLLSAGSFTEQTRINWSPECEVPAATAAKAKGIKLESFPSETEKDSSNDKLVETVYGGQGVTVKKRRGKRKRKDVKEASVGESDFLGPATDVLSASRGYSGQIAKPSGTDDQSRGSSQGGTDDLKGIYDSIVQHECASVFCRRLDSQKRGRYKKMVLRHMDFDTIRSRISNGLIVSAKELFRDMLLVANNALVFYSKNTREHKSAALLRDVLTKAFRHHYKDCNTTKASTPNLLLISTMRKPPAKPRSIRTVNQKPSRKLANDASGTPNGGKKQFSAVSPPSMESLAATKKGSGLPRKAGNRRGSPGAGTPTRGRKRCLAR